jgi:N-acetylmuramoyl-L-alanine amidase
MDIKLITVHCSATFNGEHYDVRQIDAYHKARGWESCGYHYVIQPTGEIQVGRAKDKVGAHVQGNNIYDGGINIGICLIGTDKFTLTQFTILRNLVIAIFREHGFMNLKAHYQLDKHGKTCPNIEIRDLVKWITDSAPQFLQKYTI